jgi:plasmid stabilization system protein ParE
VTFRVETTDVADAEIQAAFLRLSAWNPEFAGRWLEGLLRAIDTLDTFPTRHERAPESDVLGREVRRLLYRNGRVVYRVLFFLVDADGDGETDTVRVLHVRHGAQQPLGQTEQSEDAEPA